MYGQPPYTVVVVHGGPGAPGEMKPVAEELSAYSGVLEPIQTKNSIDGQVEELKHVIEEHATSPVYLIGWSWGAWLSYMLTARYPSLVKKLILVSSGPFEDSYAQEIMTTRLQRLSTEEQQKAKELIQLLNEGKADEITFAEFGSLMGTADSYSPIPHKSSDDKEESIVQSDIYEHVWSEADVLRKSGMLPAYGKTITCPVIAIHGDYDPHPAEGVQKPLSTVLKDFRMHLLTHCGHHPWFEKDAKVKFYEILIQEMQ